MPSFETPEAISATTHVEAGSIQFTAVDRLDTVVEVRPRDPKKDLDVRTAEQTEVTYTSGALTVRTPKSNLFGRTGTVVGCWMRQKDGHSADEAFARIAQLRAHTQVVHVPSPQTPQQREFVTLWTPGDAAPA